MSPSSETSEAPFEVTGSSTNKLPVSWNHTHKSALWLEEVYLKLRSRHGALSCKPQTFARSNQDAILLAFPKASTWATVNIIGWPKQHGSYIRTLLRPIVQSLYRTLCPAIVWPYYPESLLTVAHMASGFGRRSCSNFRALTMLLQGLHTQIWWYMLPKTIAGINSWDPIPVIGPPRLQTAWRFQGNGRETHPAPSRRGAQGDGVLDTSMLKLGAPGILKGGSQTGNLKNIVGIS